MEQVSLTLLRDSAKGLGFSIAGGKGTDRYMEDDDAVFISKVAEEGPAAREGKLRVGDKLVQVRRNTETMIVRDLLQWLF